MQERYAAPLLIAISTQLSLRHSTFALLKDGEFISEQDVTFSRPFVWHVGVSFPALFSLLVNC